MATSLHGYSELVGVCSYDTYSTTKYSQQAKFICKAKIIFIRQQQLIPNKLIFWSSQILKLPQILAIILLSAKPYKSVNRSDCFFISLLFFLTSKSLYLENFSTALTDMP